MTDNQKKLLKILREMFQFDQSDLDFGIYRIMGMKRGEINRFVDEELPAQITEGLSELAGLDTAANIAAIDKQIADTKAAHFSDAVKAAAVAELEENKKSIAGSVDIDAVEADVYNHLTNFFSRYYDDGDFISKRRYKDDVYAIPYEGEEVKLYWANADQYYVKTSEYFKDYTFKTMYGDTIRFKLVEAETERDNNKANQKRFFQLHTEQPFEVIDGDLIIYIEYKNGGKKNQAECIADIVATLSSSLADYPKFASILITTDGNTLLERQLNRYTARNTFDYFIHKDLAKFLRRELDFYIKNDVIFLDDIDEQDEAKTKEYLTKAKVIRKIAHKIIAFLAQIEDFQKKLYLKKKFVVQTDYCITLDRVPETLYPEIAANEAQHNEWVNLFAIDKIETTEGNIFNAATAAYSIPLTVDFLKQNPFLVLDTAFFSTKFKERLVDSIDSLDEKLDGLLIHSENSQVISLLKEKYHNQIKCIYIDPPYNAKSSEILYKNTFKHSSWLSLMENRLSVVSHLLKKDSVITIAIDEIEQTRLGELLRLVFPSKQITAVTVVHNPSGQQGGNFSFTNEFAYFVYNDLKDVIGKEYRDENGTDVRTFRDNSGNSNLRADAANCFYPIYVKNNEIVGFGDVSPDDYHPLSRCIPIDDNIIAVYPIDNNGVEKKWVFERGTVEEILDQLWVKEDVQRGNIDIMRSKSVFRYKTTWTEKKYSANSYGSALLTAMSIPFDYPKSIYTVIDCIKAALSDNEFGIAFDFFAGSGTTGHAIIRLNNYDSGKRKYILAEMGEHFDTATKPRVVKAIYSDDIDGVPGWKKGKPVSRKGSSHAFKYLRLESYEDALNNIVLRSIDNDMFAEIREGYMLSYMLNTEAAGSASLLNVEKLDKPFSYKMNITSNLESTECTIDLVETFNYLIGLTVAKNHALAAYDADIRKGEYGAVSASLTAGDTYKFKAVEGTVPSGDKTLVLWREMTGDIEKDNAVLDAYFLSLPNARNFRRVYVNCDNNLLNLRDDGESWQVVLIDDEMKKRMFEETE